MIDIHSHILPEVDDGARSLEESLAMARMAAGDGITHMIATPHAFNGLSDDPNTDEILRQVERLQNAIGADLQVLPGNEVRYSENIVGKARSGRLTTLNRQHYTLIELPTAHVPRGATKLFRTLREEGMTPILAHPERNRDVQSRPELVVDLIRAGALVQITAMSVTGKFGDAALASAEMLLRHNAVHFIATDTHRPDRRPPILSEARTAAAKIVGEDCAKKLVDDHPAAVIRGDVLRIDPPVAFEPADSGRLLSRLFETRS